MANETPKFGSFLGGVNPIGEKIGPRIDLKTLTEFGGLKLLFERAFTDNYLEGITEFKGQVLRVTDPRVDKRTDNPFLTGILRDIIGENYLVCKVRIPEIHSIFPIPDSFDETEPDLAIIDLYPDFILEPINGERIVINVGDIVNTTFGNLSNFTEGKIISKLSAESDGQGSRPPIGSDAEKALDSAKEGFKSKTPKQAQEDLLKIKNLNKQFDTNKITAEDFRKMFNNSSNADPYYNSFLRMFKKYGVDTPAKVAGMIGQICVETGNLRVVIELPSQYNKRNPRDPNEPIGSLYENKVNLGNNQPGDGSKFIGRGIIQLTGRENYTKAAAELKVDIVNNPSLVGESPELTVETGFLFFKNRSLWNLCQENNFDEVTRRVNGDRMLHKQDRFSYTVKALEILDKYAA